MQAFGVIGFLKVACIVQNAVKRLTRPKAFVELYRMLSHDVTAAILVSQNNETAATLVSQTSPLGVELFSSVNAFFCPNKSA